jgi:hypothetical protein
MGRLSPGVNDHLAFGLRDPMRLYLTRLRHVERRGIRTEIKGAGSEGFLGASLRWDRVQVVRLQRWMYCPHTPRNLLRGDASEGCIGRVRCRVSCRSFYCPTQGLHAGACECLNTSCTEFAAGVKVSVLNLSESETHRAPH